MNNSNREFRKVPSLYFLYEISEDGRYLRNVKSKHYLKPRLNQDYYEWCLGIKGKSITKKAHSLVAECWLGERPEGYVIDHIDRDKHNNHYSNLRYVTKHDNAMNVSEEEKERKRSSIRDPYLLECRLEVLSKPIIFGDEEFPSQREAARVLAERYNVTVDTIRNKLKRRSKVIYGVTVKYLR